MKRIGLITAACRSNYTGIPQQKKECMRVCHLAASARENLFYHSTSSRHYIGCHQPDIPFAKVWHDNGVREKKKNRREECDSSSFSHGGSQPVWS